MLAAPFRWSAPQRGVRVAASRAVGLRGSGRPLRSHRASVRRCRWTQELSAARGGVCPVVSAQRAADPYRPELSPPSAAESSPLPARPRRGGCSRLGGAAASSAAAAGPGGGRGAGSGAAWGRGGGCPCRHGAGEGASLREMLGDREGVSVHSSGGALGGRCGYQRRMLRERKPLAARLL